MLSLNENNIIEAAGLEQVMDAVEKAYRLELTGEYVMPPRMHADYGDNTILYMPCFLKSIFGTKILTLFPGNTAKNKPVIEGLVLLNDPETGEPLGCHQELTLLPQQIWPWPAMTVLFLWMRLLKPLIRQVKCFLQGTALYIDNDY